MAKRKGQTKHNKTYGTKNNLNGLCYFCTRKKLQNCSVCEIHYFRIAAGNILKDRNRDNELRDVLIKQDYKCYLTGKKLVLGINASIDHIKPKKTNPELRYDINNLAWCDYTVNMAKKHLTNEQFIELALSIVSFHKGGMVQR